MDPLLPPPLFDRERHIHYLELMLESLPAEYESQEINRLTLAYFAVSGLAILGALDRVNKDQVFNWIMSLRAHPSKNVVSDNGEFYGFHGSRTSQFPIDEIKTSDHNGSHLASTYCGFSILRTLGYDLSSVDPNILISMRKLQQTDGSFIPIHIGAETDLRFVYCAAAICYTLNNWSGMDRELARQYIISCQSFDGGFGLVPGSESHGGGTYCAVAALRLMGFLGPEFSHDSVTRSGVNMPLLLEWSLQRQATDGGFQGRTNKASDTCYAFWVGGVLKMLGAYDFIDKEALSTFLLSCQSKYGGFTKFRGDAYPDIYHSYYGLSALSFLEEPGLQPLCAELGVVAIQ